MFSNTEIAAPDPIRRIHLIQAITIAWMSIEASVSLWAAWQAGSPALLAFGGDSAIELLSAAFVLWRFRRHIVDEREERRATQITGSLLFVLALFIVATSTMTLRGHREPALSYAGIAILLAAAAIMPWLVREKRRLSSATGSAALRADAAESMLCAYLSLIALIGLAVHAIFRIAWADPVAALAITPLVVWEGIQAIRGKPCGCCLS